MDLDIRRSLLSIEEKIASVENKSNSLTTRMRVNFRNGYGVSVVRGFGTYGAEPGLFELAVLKGEELCYTTPITDDVLGYLNKDEVVAYAIQVANLT